jgi:ABC-2 type transport system ATP-binding protein
MGELVCNELTKTYRGDKRALDSVSLSIASEGIFALIGRNGAGKTTLIRMLATELEPTSGSAVLNGMEIVRDAKVLREKIAIIPQEARTIPWMTPKQTVLSYLLWRGLSFREASKRAKESLAKLGLENSADTLTRRLSGGTKRKVMIATVIASEAEIIFLDEPTTGLDPISRKELWVILKELGRERFTFLTTHYLEEAEQLADRIGILKDGRLVVEGTLRDLRERAKYQYSIKFPSNVSVPSFSEGEITTGDDGYAQLLTHEDEAFRIAKDFSENGVRFSISPISLDDIFFLFARQTAGDD